MLQTLTERLFEDGDRTGLDPFALFEEWYALAQEAEPNDPHALSLATVDESASVSDLEGIGSIAICRTGEPSGWSVLIIRTLLPF